MLRVRKPPILPFEPPGWTIWTGWTRRLLFGLKVELSAIKSIAELVRVMPEVRYLAYTTGTWDLLGEPFVGNRGLGASIAHPE